MFDNESLKPVVTYRERLGPLKVGGTTTLTDIEGHPLLGNQLMVRTSTIKDIRDDGNTIETLNTIYIKKENADVTG